jgi:hypothetical protein
VQQRISGAVHCKPRIRIHNYDLTSSTPKSFPRSFMETICITPVRRVSGVVAATHGDEGANGHKSEGEQ